MRYAVIIIPCNKGSHGNDILGVVVFYCLEIAEFLLSCCFIRNDIRHLYICPLSVGLRTDEVYLASLQLTNKNPLSNTAKLRPYNVFKYLLNISLTCSSCNGIAYAMVLEIELVVRLEYPLAMDVISVYLMDDVSITQKLQIAKYHTRGDALAL